jgi:hypothetical protein
MKFSEFPKMRLCLLLVVLFLADPSFSHADAEQRTIVVRERATASLLNGTFLFKVLKIRGYSIEVKIFGEKRVLKIGQSIAPKSAECSVVFNEIAIETRIARFSTNC